MTNKIKISTLLIYLFLIIVMIIMIIPFIWLAISSFRPNQELFTAPFSIPKKMSFDNYIAVFKSQPMLLYIFNTAAVTFITILITIPAALLAAYAFMYRFNHKPVITLLLTVGIFIPTNAFMVPYYVIINKLGFYDNIIGIALIYTGINLPMSFMVLKNFIDSIPKELMESARIDGARHTQTLLHIIMPISVPGIVTACVFIVVNSWNELLFANLLNQSDKSRTIQVAIRSFLTTFEANYAYAFAAMIITILPTIVFYILLTEKIVDGMTAGAIKG